MRKGFQGLTVFIVLAVLFGCNAPRNNTDESVSAGSDKIESAFMDFSGYSGSPTLTTYQPSFGIVGPFVLSNGIAGEGIRISNQGDGSARVTIQEYGNNGMAATSDNFLYFFIDKPSVKSAATVTMEITYFDNSNDNFTLEYVSSNPGQSPNYFRTSIQKSNSNTFVTIRIQLENCSFYSGEQQNQGAQFRFSDNAIIQRIELITGGVSAVTDLVQNDPPAFAPQTDLNNIIGKTIAGYQVWFNTANWHHWGLGRGADYKPGSANVNVELWPAGWEDYEANGTKLHDTDFIMPDGSTARLFNSKDAEAILTHHQWMREAGIDGSAIQRFYGENPKTFVDTGTAPNHLTVIRDAAEETGRIFMITYDMTHGGSNQPEVVQNIQLDWIYNIEKKGVASSPNYAHADGKPVVMIWGIHANESTENGRYPKVADTITLVEWFRNRGYYVIGGTPDDTFWVEGGGRNSRGKEMYSSFDMISPWYVGRSVDGSILSGSSYLSNGLDFCNANKRSWANNQPIDFMPVIWPGFAWVNMSGNPGTPNQIPRNAGQFIWHQVREYLKQDTGRGIKSLYMAMMDEYDEATAFMKAGVDFFDIPIDQYFLTFAADGIWLSNDYYLRLAKAISAAFKNRTGNDIGPLNDYNNAGSVIVEHSLGPVFWRNSFERREGRLKMGTPLSSVPINHLQIDVGVSGGVLGAQNVTVNGAFTVNRPAVRSAALDSYSPPSTTLGMVYTDIAKSGNSAFRLAGERTAGANALYRYKIADTRIKLESGMKLSYWQRTENILGANVIVDVQFDNGAYLSDSVTVQNSGTLQNGWQQKTAALPASLNGRYITAVIVAYKDSGTATGSFAALIDDIIIEK